MTFFFSAPLQTIILSLCDRLLYNSIFTAHHIKVVRIEILFDKLFREKSELRIDYYYLL